MCMYLKYEGFQEISLKPLKVCYDKTFVNGYFSGKRKDFLISEWITVAKQIYVGTL